MGRSVLSPARNFELQHSGRHALSSDQALSGFNSPARW